MVKTYEKLETLVICPQNQVLSTFNFLIEEINKLRMEMMENDELRILAEKKLNYIYTHLNKK